MRRLLFYIALLSVNVVAAQNKVTLQQCLDMARANNRTLKNAALEIEAGKEQLKGARTNYLPQISANVMAFQAFDDIIKGDGNYPEMLAALADVNPAFAEMAGKPFSFSEMNRAYSAMVTVTEPIYAGGKIRTGVSLSKLQTEVAELQAKMQEKDVLQKVTENYWNIATQSFYLRTIEAAEHQMNTLHDQVSLFVKAGVTTRNALLQVKLRQQELASKRLRIENGRQLLLLLLKQQVGATVDSFDIVLPNDSVYYDMPLGNGRAEAVDGREELQLAAKNVEAQKLQVKMKRADVLPTFAVGVAGYHAGLGGFSNTVKDYVPSTMTNGLALATLSIPISNWWGGSHHSVKQQKYAQAQAENDYLDARENLSIDIESAWLNLKEARKQIDIAQASVTEAEENYRMSQSQYRMGTETIADLLDAETLYRQAKDDLSAGIAAYHIRLADYNRKVTPTVQ